MKHTSNTPDTRACSIQKDASLTAEEGNKGKIGFWGLTAIVFGSIIGSSIFAVPQNIARGASAGNALLAWILSGSGIFILVLVLKRLSDSRPDLRAGVYQYAQEGFGPFLGFNTAWGYWICVLMGNVALTAMLGETVGAFFPVISHNTWAFLAFGLTVIWGMCWIVSLGIKWASKLNTILSFLKFSSLVLVIIVLALCFKLEIFANDFWEFKGNSGDYMSMSQINSCMLVSIWSFMGIEGASMMSARAKRRKDVGRSTVFGFILALGLYLLVSMLCYGIMGRSELSELPNPSTAYILEHCTGPWAKWFLLAAVGISLAGGFIAWTLVCAQVPMEAARCGIFPGRFRRLNSHGMPGFGLNTSAAIMTLCLILVIWADNVYVAALNLTSTMVLPTYFFACLYLLKQSSADLNNCHISTHQQRRHASADILLAIIGIIFCLYIAVCTSIIMMMATSIFYLLGTGIFIWTKRRAEGPSFKLTYNQKVIIAILVLMVIMTIWLMSTSRLQLDQT